MNDDLHVADVGKRVERDSLQRPDPCDRQQDCSGKDQKAVALAPFNDVGDHHMPPVALTLSCPVAIGCAARSTATVTCHVPPVCNCTGAAYGPLPLSARVATAR